MKRLKRRRDPNFWKKLGILAHQDCAHPVTWRMERPDGLVYCGTCHANRLIELPPLRVQA